MAVHNCAGGPEFVPPRCYVHSVGAEQRLNEDSVVVTVDPFPDGAAST